MRSSSCSFGDIAFIVVGMTAGELQGAPAVTFDLDIVYPRDAANVAKLLDALHELVHSSAGELGV